MLLKDIYNNINYIDILNKVEANIDFFSIDSRENLTNAVYIGIKGDNFDGNKFYMEAFKKGAICVIASNISVSQEEKKYLIDNNRTIILVEDTQVALENLAKYKRSTINIPIIAVTGSAGKTSTKDLIHSVLNEKFNAYKTIGNKNNHLGLPLTLLNLKNEEIAVLEMGMNHYDEIRYLTNIARPTIAIITNIGTAHIGNFGSRKNILKAKLEIIEGLDKDGIIIVNNDDNLLNKWALENKDNYNIRTFSVKKSSDLKATKIKTDEYQGSFIYNDENYVIPVSGEHYIYNSLPALLVAQIYHLTTDEIKKGLLKLELSSNRMELTSSNNINYINDVYNANYNAMKYAIKYLGEFKGRNIACLGTMLELGDKSEMLHRKIAHILKEEEVDMLITVGSEANYINKEIREEKLEIKEYNFNNNQEASHFINSIKKEDDTILVKASAGVKFIEIIKDIK